MPFATVVIRGNNCHTSLWGVMANSGFGRVTIIRDGVKYMLPKEAVFKSGKIKKKYMEAIEEYRIEAAA